MIFPLIPIPFGRIQLYQKPISMRFDERKLTQLCCQELGREPKTNELFLFYNTKRDTPQTVLARWERQPGDYQGIAPGRLHATRPQGRRSVRHTRAQQTR